MAISFQCNCGQTFKVADQYAGKRSKCTHCGAMLIIPDAQPPGATPVVGSPFKSSPPSKVPRPSKSAPLGAAPPPAPDAAPRQLEGWAPKPSNFPMP